MGGVEDGRASLVVAAEVNVTDPDDSDGHITFAELSQAEFGLGVLGTLEAELPLNVSLSGIGDITDFGTPTVLISADELITGSAPNFTVNRPRVSVNILLDNPDVQANILALLNDLKTGGIGSLAFLDDELPLIKTSINDLLDVGTGIGDLLDLYTSVKGFFDSFDTGGSNEGGTPDLAGLVDWVVDDVTQKLSGLLIGGDLADGPFTMSGGLDFSTNTLLFDFDFDLNKASNITVDVDDLVPGGGFIDFGGAINAELQGSVSAGLGLGLDLVELFSGTASEAVFLTVDDFSVGGELHIPDLDLTVGLGTAVSGGIVDGTLDLELGVTLSVADPNDDGRLTLNEIQAEGFGNLVSLDASASVDAAMPLNITVAGFDPTLYGTPVVYLNGEDFLQFDLNASPKFTFTRPDLVFDIKLTAAFRDAVMGVLLDLDTKIDNVVSGPVGEFLTFDVPGLNTTVGDLLGVNDLVAAFNLYDVADPYFQGYSFTGTVGANPDNFPSLLGLLEELNTGVATKSSVAIDAFNVDNAGGNFAGLDAVTHFTSKSWPLDLRGFDFQNANLNGVNFTGFDLSGVDFRGADLRGAILTNANLRGADFTGARLQGTLLDEALAVGAVFKGIKLGKLDSIKTNFEGLIFDRTTVWRDGQGNRTTMPSLGPDVEGTASRLKAGLDLTGRNFEGWDLSGLDFSGVVLTGANLSFANLRAPRFRAARLHGRHSQWRAGDWREPLQHHQRRYQRVHEAAVRRLHTMGQPADRRG